MQLKIVSSSFDLVAGFKLRIEVLPDTVVQHDVLVKYFKDSSKNLVITDVVDAAHPDLIQFDVAQPSTKPAAAEPPEPTAGPDTDAV
jgi:hypothetical protein